MVELGNQISVTKHFLIYYISSTQGLIPINYHLEWRI